MNANRLIERLIAAVIFPFQCMGDEKLFLNANPIASPSAMTPNFTTQGSWTTLSPGVFDWTWPVTASGLLIEVTASNTDTNVHTLGFLDPSYGVTPSVANCKTGSQAQNLTELYSIPASTSLQTEQFWLTPSTNAGAMQMKVSACDNAWGAGGVNANIVLRGYREMVHHLDQIHP